MAAILAFGAHPDDIEFGCGGTVRKLIEKGWSAVHVCVTSGEAGSSTIDRATLAAPVSRKHFGLLRCWGPSVCISYALLMG
jgi:LmbE family N-acetylglucosaminyl deacetylase